MPGDGGLAIHTPTGTQPLRAKRVAAIQSNYIPWKGYFDIIRAVDEFVLYDDVQYTPRNWRNRNRIKTPAGVKWLTVPVSRRSGRSTRQCLIHEMRVANRCWSEQHWRAVEANYRVAPFFSLYEGRVRKLFEGAARFDSLSEVNRHFIMGLCSLLHIDTRISWSMDYGLAASGKNERPLELALKSGAGIFVSGPKAKAYFMPHRWHEAGVQLRYFEYNYDTYPQLYPPFEHGVTVLDLLFNTGDDAPSYLIS